MSMNELTNILVGLESNYTINYPNNGKATYTSELNYSLEYSTPFQRWYRYKEGFSYILIKKLIEEYSINDSGYILDPFIGSGTTALAANSMARNCVGFETNPFSAFVSKCKLTKYSDEDINELIKFYDFLKNINLLEFEEYPLPKLRFASEVFNSATRKDYMSLRTIIEKEKLNVKKYDLLKFCWLSILEEISNYRKAGNGLKKKHKFNDCDVKELFLKKLDVIINDISNYQIKTEISIIEDSSLNLNNYFEDLLFDGIIYSPPYANCFDYFEIYKLELWFGNFVNSYEEMRKLKSTAMRSNLSNVNDLKSSNESILKIIDLIDKNELWDKKIVKMLNNYFIDFEKILNETYKVLKKDGFCCIIVGNSSYAGVVIPTDLIVAQLAEKIGYKVEKINIDRFLITSSQQYNKTIDYRKYLRESIVCLRKL